MPRGVRRVVNYEDELEGINAEIEQLSSKLSALKEQKKSLESRKSEKEMQEVTSLLRESGRTIEDLKSMLVSMRQGE